MAFSLHACDVALWLRPVPHLLRRSGMHTVQVWILGSISCSLTGLSRQDHVGETGVANVSSCTIPSDGSSYAASPR